MSISLFAWKRSLLFSFALLAATLPGLAQSSDNTVGVSVALKGLGLSWNDAGSAVFSTTDLGGYKSVEASQSDSDTPQILARFLPGKVYYVSVESSELSELTLQAVPEIGYEIEIESVPRERLPLQVSGFITKSVRVLSPANQVAARGGTATSLSSGSVYWQVSMGSLANGSSAGSIGFIDTGTGGWGSLFSAQGLIYVPTSSEVEVILNGPGATAPYVPGTIRQVIAPQVCADVVLTGTYQCEIKFYHASQRITSGSAPYAFTGDPFAWYLVNQDGAVPNRIQINCDLRNVVNPTDAFLPVVQTKITTLERTGTSPDFTWTARDWYASSSSPLSEDVRSRSGSNESEVVRVPGGATASASSRVFGSLPWGTDVSSETVGSSSGLTTNFSYYTSDAQSVSYGRLRSRAATGGGWEAYEYYDYSDSSAEAGTLKRVHRPFKDSSTSAPSDLPSDTTNEVTTFTYGLDPFGRKTRVTSTETKIGGYVTARSETSYASSVATFTGHPHLNLITAERKDYAGASTYLTTTTKYFREDSGTVNGAETDDFYRGQPHSIVRPDGVKQSFAYQRGTWDGTNFTLSGNGGSDDGAASRISVITGAVSGDNVIYTYDGYNIEDLELIDRKSTMEVAVRDIYARLVRTESHIWADNTWQRVGWINYTYDLANRLVGRTASNGATYSATYDGERKTSETEESGIQISYGHDDANRVVSAAKTSGPSSGFTYDAADRVLNQTRTGGGETITNARAYDDAGRLSSETPAGLGSKVYSYDPSNRKVTLTLPDSATRIEEYYPDGQIKNLSGSSVVLENYDYAVESDGRRTARANIGVNNTSSARYQFARTDWLGRTVYTERSGFTGQSAFTETYNYDATTGQLRQLDRSGGLAPTLYEYDQLGRVKRSGLRLSGSGGLVLASNDRITDSNESFEFYAGAWWSRSETKIYPTAGSATAKVASATRRRLTGHPSNRFNEVETIDIEGNGVVQTVDVNTSTKTVTITTTRPGVSASQVETVVNGIPASVQGHDGLTVTTTYDALERAWKTTDPRNNTSTVSYYSGTNLVHYATDSASKITTYAYDSSGRRAWVQDAATQTTYFGYNNRSQLIRQWGSVAYPVEYGYSTTYGERTSLSTYRGGSGWDGSSWPGSTGTADTTTWTFDGPSGLLERKTDAANRSVVYTYNALGQTATRAWARGVTTTYSYASGTGELSGTTYSDGTPAVSYAYTRLGQLDHVTDVTGTRAFDYDPNEPLRQIREAHSSFYADRVLTRLYDAASGIGGGYAQHTAGFVKGRGVGFELGVTGNQGRDLHQHFTYSNLGWFAGVNTRAAGSSARDFVNSYTSAGLLSGYNTGGPGGFTLSYGYESTRNLRTMIMGSWGATAVTCYDSEYNDLGQRRWAKQSGFAFTDYVAGTGYNATFNYYTYNGRGELSAAAMYRGDNPPSSPPSSNDELPGRRFSYQFDNIGNRLTAGPSGSSNSSDDEYTANALNQYTAKENNTVRVLGTAAPSASVAADGAAVTKKDRSFAADLLPANGSGPVHGSLTLYAALVGAGPGGKDLVRSQTRTWAIAQALQSFTYDEDGNMTGDGVWNYTYDAENRLVQMTTTSVAVMAGFPNRTLEFKYDYLHRRVQKRSLNQTTSTDVYRRYLYDGWALIAETDTAGTILRSYTWGVDLAGSVNATGGVGALLQITNHNANDTRTSYFPSYDPNGNVAALVREDGALAAAYEYSPAGELLRDEHFDSAIADNPFKFSTKFTDAESGLVYYGARFYSSALGRFINRDPIEEQGGLNLYGFCGNDGVNGIDYLGFYLMDPYIVVGTKVGASFGPIGAIVGGTIGAIATIFTSGSIGSFFKKLFGGGGGKAAPPPKPATVVKATTSSIYQPQYTWNGSQYGYWSDGYWMNMSDYYFASGTVELEPVIVTASRLPSLASALMKAVTIANPGIGIAQQVASEYRANLALGGGHFNALNMTGNPAYMAMAGFNESFSGIGMGAGDAGKFLSGWQRSLSFGKGLVGTVGTALAATGITAVGSNAARTFAAERGVPVTANFAQTSFREAFSKTGAAELSKLTGRSIKTVDDLIAAIRSGVDPSKIPVNYIQRGGNITILNTRTAQALERAGVPRSLWNGVNKSGDSFFEQLLSDQLRRNQLSPAGTPLSFPE